MTKRDVACRNEKRDYKEIIGFDLRNIEIGEVRNLWIKAIVA